MAPDEEMIALRQKLSGLAERIALGFKLTLDYSEQSVDRVEKVLAAIHVDYKKTRSEDGIRGIALNFAAYLVTVLERLYGPVIWRRDHPEMGEETFPVEWRGVTLFPYGWCLKRIVDGPGDDIRSKWKALVSPRVKQ
jgi:hypothetical protein